MKTIYPLAPAAFIFPLGCLFLESPVGKLLWATLGLLFLLKLGSWLRNALQGLPTPGGWGRLCFLLGWPGMRPESFAEQRFLNESVGRVFVQGFVFFLSGCVCQIVLMYFWNHLFWDVALYLGLFSFLLVLHFGFAGLIFVAYRLLGYPVEPLFREPFRSESLRDFWGRRWNLAFVDMDKRLFLPLFSKRWGNSGAFAGIFLLSGLLHEMGISYPAGGGWGLPLVYFLLHGALTLLEPHVPGLNKNILIRRIWLWAALLIPLPLLFHRPFLETFIAPYFALGHDFLHSVPLREVLNWLVWLAGFGHLLILVASFQVPGKLNWREDFAKLNRFNRKIFWTYGGYIVFCILAFAAVDLWNSRGLLEPHPSSTAIALFIALFWTVRVLIDFIYFKHDDWPQGDEFVVGHTMLTALFASLAIVHWAVVFWHLGAGK